MKTSKQVETITPALAKDVSFSEKVEAVDTALRTRASVQREIKLKWARVVQVLTKYEVVAPGRRVEAATAVGLVRDLVVYMPRPEISPEYTHLLDADGSYILYELAARPNLLRLVDAKVAGLKKLVEELVEARDSSREKRLKDETKTKEARAELQTAVDEYLVALESYDDTVTSVANVKEYIGVMKDIADISAIALGVKAKD